MTLAYAFVVASLLYRPTHVLAAARMVIPLTHADTVELVVAA